MDILDEVLEHHGVKGMKWGVRKDRGHEGQRAKTKKIARLDKKFERAIGTLHTTIKIHNAAVDGANHSIQRINNKPEYKNKDFTRDTPLRRKYIKEHQRSLMDNLDKAAASLGTNASGTKRYGIYENINGSWDVVLKDVQHAAGDDLAFTVSVIYDDHGYITELRLPDAVEHGEVFVSDFLAHYGVPGMKWGVRKASRSTPSGPTDVVLRTKGGTKIKTTGGKGHPPSEDAKRTAISKQKAKKSSTNSLTNKELQEAIQRMNLERQYKSLTTTNPVKKFVSKLLADAGQREVSKAVNKQVEKALEKK